MELAKKNGQVENQTGKIKHPPGLYLLFMTEMWERFSYYGMRALLVLYLTSSLVAGGLGFDKVEAMKIYGMFTSLVYFTPIIGGYLSDRLLGQRKAITIGGITMALGQFSLFASQSKGALYLGLFLLIIGNGFFKPNISTIVGQLYPDGDKRRDAAFTIFYMGINLGALIAPLICGTFAEQTFATIQGGTVVHYGFKFGFLAAGVGMVCGQLMFNLLGKKYLGDIGINPAGTVKGKDGKTEHKNEPLTKKEKQRTIVIFVLAAFVIFFWAGFEQAGSSLTIFTKDLINRNVMGTEVPVSWFQSINPFFIIILAPIIGKLWVKLGSRPQGDLSTPTKMAIGLILLGLGFLLMVGACMQRGNAGPEAVNVKANMMWVFGLYFMETVGELCLSPVGLSMVSKIAPKKLASLLMGIWLLSSCVANYLAGFLASFADQLGYLELYGGIAAVVIVCGLILLAFNKKLTALME